MYRSLSINLQLLLVCLIALLCICTDLTEARTSSQLKVKLDHGGVLVGRHWTSRSGRHIRAFVGVPYAKPPLDELRFKPPVPFGSWVGERWAVEESDKCIQRDPFRGEMEVSGVEDCLYINVYTPEEPETTEPLPVMVWFHGGAFECGSGISHYYGPKYLMDKDVIFISANYRLGPLGFLSTETLDCPGNFGLKDQNLVLKWVQENIAAFGGNPKSVTVFGESAGGASVTYHMFSEKSKGLVHKGIAQSGTFYNPWAQPAHKGVPAKRARELADIVGCDGTADSWTSILDCLRTKSAHDVTAAFYDLFEWDMDPMIPFPPVVEPAHEGAFITELPRAQDPAQSNAIPLMIGFTSDEGLLRTVGIVNRPHMLEDFKNKFNKVLPIILNYDHFTQNRQNQITNALINFYLKNGLDFGKQNHQNLTDIVSDGWFIAGLDEHIRQRLSDKSSAPTYVYIFDHKGYSSLTEIFHGGEDYYGACHADELLYLFPITEDLLVTSSPTKRDRELSAAIVDLWVNFATTGNPTPKLSDKVKWPIAQTYPPTFLRIGSKHEHDPLLRLSDEYPLDRINLWHELKPFLPADQSAQHEEL